MSPKCKAGMTGCGLDTLFFYKGVYKTPCHKERSMSENFASFYRKASSVRELVGKAPFPEKVRFQITKVIELQKEQYRRYRNELLRDVSFISGTWLDMRFDGKTETFLCCS